MADAFEFTHDDFANGLDEVRMHREISVLAGLGLELRHTRRIQTDRNDPSKFKFRIKFERDLTAGEEAALVAAIAAHDPDVPLPPGFLLSELNANEKAGTVAFARDVRKVGEGAGAGTGSLVYSDGVTWLRCRDDGAPEV